MSLLCWNLVEKGKFANFVVEFRFIRDAQDIFLYGKRFLIYPKD